MTCVKVPASLSPWNKLSPWGWLVFFPLCGLGKSSHVPPFPPSLQGVHVVWWLGARTLVSESPEGYPGADAACKNLSKVLLSLPHFFNCKSEMLTI